MRDHLTLDLDTHSSIGTALVLPFCNTVKVEQSPMRITHNHIRTFYHVGFNHTIHILFTSILQFIEITPLIRIELS